MPDTALRDIECGTPTGICQTLGNRCDITYSRVVIVRHKATHQLIVLKPPHGMQADTAVVHPSDLRLDKGRKTLFSLFLSLDRCTHSSVLTVFLHKQRALNHCRAFRQLSSNVHVLAACVCMHMVY